MIYLEKQVTKWHKFIKKTDSQWTNKLDPITPLLDLKIITNIHFKNVW